MHEKVANEGSKQAGIFALVAPTVFAYFVNTVSFGFFALFEFHNAHSVAHALHTVVIEFQKLLSKKLKNIG